MNAVFFLVFRDFGVDFRASMTVMQAERMFLLLSVHCILCLGCSLGKHVAANPSLRAAFTRARASIWTILVSARSSIRGLLPRLLSAPKSQRFLRFAIAMPIADPRNRAISETRESNAALRFKSAMESR